MQLKVLTYNTLFGGRDGADDRRAKLQLEIISDVAPDIFLMQEAKGFDANGGEAFLALEVKLQMRGFLAIAKQTGQHTGIFIRQPVVPVRFESDRFNFHHALAKLTVSLPTGQALMLLSAHLCPYGLAVRQREACYLTPFPDPHSFALLAGDFNSMSPHDPDPEDLERLSFRDRSRYLGEFMRTPDRSVLTRLEHAGWVDIGKALDGNKTPTVPAKGFKETEFPTMRCDYIMTSQSLASHAVSYSVIRTPEADTASDHYPVTTTFEIPEA